MSPSIDFISLEMMSYVAQNIVYREIKLEELREHS